MNRFDHRGSLHWHEFAPFLRRNVASNVQLRIFGPAAFEDMVTIMDYNLPHRKGLTYTKEGHHADWERDSMVCNVGWIGGEIPIIGWGGSFEDDDAPDGTHVFDKRPCRGALQAVQILLNKKVLKLTDEVKEFLVGTQPQADAYRLSELEKR